jgi:hypothetical protein
MLARGQRFKEREPYATATLCSVLGNTCLNDKVQNLVMHCKCVQKFYKYTFVVCAKILCKDWQMYTCFIVADVRILKDRLVFSSLFQYSHEIVWKKEVSVFIRLRFIYSAAEFISLEDWCSCWLSSVIVFVMFSHYVNQMFLLYTVNNLYTWNWKVYL